MKLDCSLLRLDLVVLQQLKLVPDGYPCSRIKLI